ncbi:MAG: ChaN family lipoprotein [Desulfobacterales bacterium]|jgi:uncharacterized iron-regulated protein
MKKPTIWIGAGMLMAAAVLTLAAADQDQLYSIAGQKKVPLKEAASALKKDRIVLVGEHHDNAAHHAQQLAVIRTLKEAGAKVAIGMEMFRSDSQSALEAWTAGKIPEAEFVRIYYDNWNFDWELYAPILRFARDSGIPVVGLNVSRKITSQVARRGFQSLSEEQRGKLKDVACVVDRTYMEFIKRAYGAHAHGNLDFTFFCEAQLVWDNIMAINALDFVNANPDYVMVIVTGNGHAWKGGIPAQIASRSEVPVSVILPEIPAVTEPGMVDTGDADYLFLQ